jgi:alpha-1,4-galacturonosyltransferase
MRSPVRIFTDEKVKQMKDDLIRAKAYLSMTPPGSNSHLVKELRLRIKESERAVSAANKDSDLSRRYLHHQYMFSFDIDSLNMQS